MALHSLYCADVPWRNCSLTHPACVCVRWALSVQRVQAVARCLLLISCDRLTGVPWGNQRYSGCVSVYVPSSRV